MFSSAEDSFNDDTTKYSFVYNTHPCTLEIAELGDEISVGLYFANPYPGEFEDKPRDLREYCKEMLERMELIGYNKEEFQLEVGRTRTVERPLDCFISLFQTKSSEFSNKFIGRVSFEQWFNHLCDCIVSEWHHPKQIQSIQRLKFDKLKECNELIKAFEEDPDHESHFIRSRRIKYRKTNCNYYYPIYDNQEVTSAYRTMVVALVKQY